MNPNTFVADRSVTPTIPYAVLRFVTPEMFGAVGDNTTDDTTAINAACATGLPVKIQSQYHTTSAVSPVSNQTIFSDGYNSFIRCTGNNVNAVQLLGVSGVTVQNVYVINSGSYNSGLNGAAVYIAVGANSNAVVNCRLSGQGAGITLSSDHNYISGNKIVTTGASDCQWDIGIYNSGSNNLVIGNYCLGDQSRIGIVVQAETAAMTNNVVTGNIVDTKGAYGILFYNGLFPVTYSVCSNNRISNISGVYNILGTWAVVPGDNPFGAGIYVQTADYTTITGNVINNTNTSTNVDQLAPGGIGCSGTSIVTITGNVIENSSYYGITVNSGYSVGSALGGSVIADNTIDTTGFAGIRIRDQDYITCTGNVITHSSDQGIYVDGDLAVRPGVVVSNNVVSTATGDGISINSISAITLSGNKALATSRGIAVANCVDGIIVGNEVRNSTSANDVVIDSSCSGDIIFANNIVKSSTTNGVVDQVGMYYGINVVSGQTNTYPVDTAISRLLASSATPSVENAGMCLVNSATPVTDLTGGQPGQILNIRATGNTTLKHAAGSAGTQLQLSGATDYAMVNGDTITLIQQLGASWYELARSSDHA